MEQLQVIALRETDTSTNLVLQFLNSIVTSPVKVIPTKNASPVKVIPTKEGEMLTPTKELFRENDVLVIDDNGDKSDSAESLDIAAKAVLGENIQLGVTFNNSSVS